MSAQHHHTAAQGHHTAADGDHPGGEHHEEPAEETLAPDELPTPLWLPVLGAVLFFLGFILIAAL